MQLTDAQAERERNKACASNISFYDTTESKIVEVWGTSSMKKFTVKIQQVFSQEQEARLQGIYDIIFDLIDKEAEAKKFQENNYCKEVQNSLD